MTMIGFGLPTDALHAPNEHFALEQFHGATVAMLTTLELLSLRSG